MYIFISDEQYEQAAKRGINKRNVWQRVFVYCWDVERAITRPLSKKSPWVKWKHIARRNGISGTTFHSRIRHGWDEKRAATTPPRNIRRAG